MLDVRASHVRRRAFEAYHQLKYLIASQITPALSRLTCYLLIMYAALFIATHYVHWISKQHNFTGWGLISTRGFAKMTAFANNICTNYLHFCFVMYVVIVVEFEISRPLETDRSTASECTYTQTAAGHRVSAADGAAEKCKEWQHFSWILTKRIYRNQHLQCV